MARKNQAMKRKTHKEKYKTKKQKNKKFPIAVLFILAILFSVSITEFTYFFYKVKYVKVYDMEIRVEKKLGLSTDTQGLNFGILPPGATSQKDVVIVNNENIPLKVTALIKGEIKKYAFVGENNFIVEPSSMKELSVIAFVPTDTDFGNYTGKLTLLLTRA